MIDPPRNAGVTTEHFARQVLTGLFQAIIAEEQGALEGDVTAVHDMRVCTRRLRASLSNFAVILSREDRLRLQTDLKNLANQLGAVRDFDVMIETLRTLLRERPKEKAIKAVIGRLQARRRRRLRRLATYLSGEDFAALKVHFSALWKEESMQIKSHGQAA